MVRYFFIGLFLLITLSSCLYLGGATYVNPKVAVVKTAIPLSVKKLSVMGSVRVVLTNEAGITAVMAEELVPMLEFEEQEGVMVIRPIKKFRPFGRGTFELRVGIRQLSDITISTDREVTTEEPLVLNTLNLTLAGANYGTINSNISNLNLTVNSAKAFTLTGNASIFNLTTNHMAIVRLKRFTAANQTITSKTGAVITL